MMRWPALDPLPDRRKQVDVAPVILFFFVQSPSSIFDQPICRLDRRYCRTFSDSLSASGDQTKGHEIHSMLSPLWQNVSREIRVLVREINC
jgi:hypothetical protein